MVHNTLFHGFVPRYFSMAINRQNSPLAEVGLTGKQGDISSYINDPLSRIDKLCSNLFTIVTPH